MKKILATIIGISLVLCGLCTTVSAEESEVYSLYGKSANTAPLSSREEEIEMLQYALNQYVTHLRFNKAEGVDYEGITTPLTEGCEVFENDLFYALATTYGGYWEANLEIAKYSNGAIHYTYVYTNDSGITVRYYDTQPNDLYITYTDMALFPYAYKTNNAAVISKEYQDLFELCKDVVDKCRLGAETDDVLYEMKVHAWICDNMVYDNALTVFSAEGALRQGKGVCQAYAELFQLLMKMGGVDCWYVWGTAQNSAGVMQKHAWNCVKLNDNYYYVDATWDDVNESSLAEFKAAYSDYDSFEIVTEKDERGYDTNYLKGYKGDSWVKIVADYRYTYFDRGYTAMSADHFMWTEDYLTFYNS